MFGRATIRLGIGPHSSCLIDFFDSATNLAKDPHVVLLLQSSMGCVLKYDCS